MTAASGILMFGWAVSLMVYIIQLHLPAILKTDGAARPNTHRIEATQCRHYRLWAPGAAGRSPAVLPSGCLCRRYIRDWLRRGLAPDFD
ncbi:hypothetical protein HGG75_24635 [Ochrobactrum pseudogrignonense]|nr:hypothetical protein [Brucella pseudogrignonensis]